MRKAIVIGAGVVGTTTALYLAREGLAVTVVDGHPASGMETSFANGGLITPSTAMPWSSPAVPGQLLRWLGREDAPLLLRSSAIPGLGLWGLRFLANCRPDKFLTSARKLTRFARTSLEETEGLIAQKVVRFELRRGGLLELFREEGGIAARDAHADLIESMGMRVKRLDAAACISLEPNLAPIGDSIRAGLLLVEDAWGDARMFTRASEEAACEAGVDFRYNTAVGGLEVSRGCVTGIMTETGTMHADVVVLCAGAVSPRLVSRFGIHLPIKPVKGYSLTIPQDDIGFLPNLPILDDTAHIGVIPLQHHLRVSGTVEFDGYNQKMRSGRIENLKGALRALFPEAPDPKTLSPWCGFRPVSADGLPIIDQTSVEGLFVNCGHGALGWTLACGSAQHLTNIVVGRPTLTETSQFGIERNFW